MTSTLYWVDGPWSGRLALSARPRGGDWLEDEVSAWKRSGVDAVLSLLTPGEERDLELASEGKLVRAAGLRFFRCPVEDRQTPTSDGAFLESLAAVDRELSAGRKVVLHCRQGIGRTGLFAACLLVGRGVEPDIAVAKLSKARGLDVPETPEQRRWIDRYAVAGAVAHHE
ncbi:MAG: dual specificity protein phosphatase family protein [Verrucomicrobiales bacterium]|nr:dual specificity protein phosphatase family protein [Bryobacterales bacterium]MCP5528790.1 dual specificity protein phosphatase family protein [Verrucomicrobiales bacterium]